MSINKNYLTVKELADIKKISRIAVFKQIKQGKIRAEKIGRNYIIYKKDSLGGNKDLSNQDKTKIENGVKKVLKDYGEVIKMLGKE